VKGLEPAEPVRRYERDHPGDLIHTKTPISRLGLTEKNLLRLHI
jgi:hypothetical protein